MGNGAAYFDSNDTDLDFGKFASDAHTRTEPER